VPHVPTISVIVPVYNAERTIEDCILSLLALAHPRQDFEILLVDNASRDGTSCILTRYENEARLLYEARRGPAAARNRGLRHARGEVVAFTDADCVVHENWLREITSPLTDEEIGIAGGTILAKRPYTAIEKFGERIHDHRLAINDSKPPYVITMNWASRISVLREAGFFDEGLRRCEDVDLAYRVMQAGYRFTFAPNAIVYHRNERTLPGLFSEGWLHGYHSIKVLNKHRSYVAPYKKPGEERNWWLFTTGKLLGKALGSLRARTWRP
jgi:glycosyltransferase involved in cell wall biosynthesis